LVNDEITGTNFADSPCGKAKKIRSQAFMSSASVGSNTFSLNDTNCGCDEIIEEPAAEPAAIYVRSKSGCDVKSRSSSPPAYPLAPTTPTLMGQGYPLMYNYPTLCIFILFA
jgi:hypothetical protein